MARTHFEGISAGGGRENINMLFHVFFRGGGGGSLHALVVNTGNWDVFMRCTTGLEIQKNSEPVQTLCISKETHGGCA